MTELQQRRERNYHNIVKHSQDTSSVICDCYTTGIARKRQATTAAKQARYRRYAVPHLKRKP